MSIEHYVKKNGWIGVDFDGTLVFHDHEVWTPWNVFGRPIEPMVQRVKQWRKEGREVRILTARVFPFVSMEHTPRYQMTAERKCLVTGQIYTITDMVEAIQAHCRVIIGERLPVTCAKDFSMLEFWDDRAVQVVVNTGYTLAEEHEARAAALRGEAFQR